MGQDIKQSILRESYRVYRLYMVMRKRRIITLTITDKISNFIMRLYLKLCVF